MAVLVASDRDFNRFLQQYPKVVVKYHAGWCGSCRLFDPKFRRLSEEDGFRDVTFLDVDAEQNPEARKAVGVTDLPFFAVFQNGQLQDTLASRKEEQVVALIRKLHG
ncbi:Thiol-disulfide isomerase or thioredoxin [Catalinimonas alkaloidigena]|uniref:Thiol-disulfide isomerase or thioredoxin n=1 Tax=Catalinimonas alkaloidigena TaxID=1075417 RepID=A0A1G9K3Z3_9BACT|nr:thioredoxin family protein [Catalinimonas alkaloidigena]SDL44501.1 Thiol-disulfide isomerase or thioredoxin [Catalinimonas alkaloidigena]